MIRRAVLGTVAGLVLAVIFMGGILIGVSVAPSEPTAPVPAPGNTYGILSTTYAGHRLFERSCPVRAVVNSAYLYEINLLDGHVPAADIDYMNSYAVHCVVSLPGFNTDFYTYTGSVYVEGSGWVEKWIAPNGGHFAFLHIAVPFVPTAGMPRFYPPPAPTGHGGDTSANPQGDEATAAIVGSVSTVPTTLTVARYPGGAVVGQSGWPSSYTFSNGSCWDYLSCASDAHLCFLTSARAASFFYSILNGAHKKPVPKQKPFAYGAWNEYRVSHHLRVIKPYDKHHHLTWPASQWLKFGAHKAGPIVSAPSWHPRPRGNGYMAVRFLHYRYFWWPHHGHWRKWERARPPCRIYRDTRSDQYRATSAIAGPTLGCTSYSGA
jgi:hypothetical protein